LIDLIAYILVRVLNKIFSVIPISFSLWLGRRLGLLVFFINRKRRVVAYANLKAAFAKEKSPAELRAITKKVYQTLVQTFVEVLNLTKVNKAYVDRYVEVVNMERVRNASKSGRGTILLTAHFGDWELSGLVSSVVGYPILVLAREQKMKRLNEALNRLRESNGCKVIRKGMQTKNILRALHNNQVVGILSDQDAGKNGMFVNFFGRPTSCHTGPFEIARKTNAIILPNFIVRTGGAHHKLYLEEYIDFSDPGSTDDIRRSLQKFANVLEAYIRKYPDQWLWMHKRWKSTPVRTVLVLNDGKAGHLNQSLAIASDIQRSRATQGYGINDTHIEKVDVKYKSSIHRALLKVLASFASWRCHGCMKCMKLCLEPDTYDRLMRSYSEFVVSCGSSLAPVNVFMSKENNAKNIVVMKPDIMMGLRQFSLAVIPRHDDPPKRKNVVSTYAAPNLIDEGRLRNAGEKLRRQADLGSDRIVGLLLGGDNPEFRLTGGSAAAVLDAALRFCDETDSQLLVTTSRRTPGEVERYLIDRLKGDPRCKLLVIANQDNPKDTMEAILDLSRLLLVSGESISMISEAVSSAKRVIVFELEKKDARQTKHEKTLNAMRIDGYIDIAKPAELLPAMKRAWADTRPVKEFKDAETIYQAVRKII